MCIRDSLWQKLNLTVANHERDRMVIIFVTESALMVCIHEETVILWVIGRHNLIDFVLIKVNDLHVRVAPNLIHMIPPVQVDDLHRSLRCIRLE